MPLKTLLTWHVAQACVACAPARANVVPVLWLKLAGFHAGSVYLWQESHVVANPAAACGGFLEFW